MKILHISTSDNGGAGIACIRLHKALLSKSIDSKVLILDGEHNPNLNIYSYSQNFNTKIQKAFFLFKRHFLPLLHQYKIRKFNFTESFSFLYTFFKIHNLPLIIDSDIIHLHYIADFIDYKSFFNNVKKPFVWTLHDMNPFSGGLHSPSLTKLNSKLEKKLKKLDKSLENRKKKILKQVNKMVLISPSNWLYKLSSESSIQSIREHHVIPHFVDTNVFMRRDKHKCREILGFDLSKKILLFVTDRFSRKLKGFEYFKEICRYYKNDNNFLFCSVGKDDNFEKFSNPNYINLGYIDSERLLAIIYSASDILIQSSLHEAFSLTTLEAMSCGLPVIAFDTTGPREIIEHKINGILSPLGNVTSFTENIDYLLSNEHIYLQISNNAYEHAQSNYNKDKIIEKYIKLYEQIYNTYKTIN